MHPSLMPWGPGKPVRLTGGLRRVMIIEELRGRSARCSWMALGKMHSDWFCLSGLVPAHARSPETRAKISASLKAKGVKPPPYSPPRVRPLDGTEERKLFDKIADHCGLGAAAAHAELRRGTHG